MPRSEVYGWDVGGAHVKACRIEGGEVVDVALWACPLWQGLEQLEQVLQAAQARWPQSGMATHAVTMTGEMVDLFAHREEGVQRIAALLAHRLAPATVRFYAGDAGWCGSEHAAAKWEVIASANWLATATHAARAHGAGVLVDIGSTTTDLVAFRAGRVLTSARSDAQRLVSGELVYQGVVRTPLCALAPRIEWRDQLHNVMNEFFATTADVYRLTGELDPVHDLHPPADGAAKDLGATRQRLARMIGLDARDGGAEEWLAFAGAWRECQLAELGSQLQRVMASHDLGRETQLVGAGCGDFLVPELVRRSGASGCIGYGEQVAHLAGGRHGLAGRAQVCAPCIAVGTLLEQEQR